MKFKGTASKLLLCVIGVAMLAACVTMKKDDDHGQTRDRPTGGGT